MTPRNLTWLRKETCRVLSVNPESVDSAFSGTADDPWEFIDVCINEAIEEEVENIALNSDYERVLESQSFTWGASARTLTLPAPLDDATLIRLEDETHGLPGTTILVHSRSSGYEPEVSWLTRNVLQWGSSGPGETKTVRGFYVVADTELSDPAQEPVYIPHKFRWVLVYGAAINARTKVGEGWPDAWEIKRNTWRENMLLAFGKGRPRDPNAPQQMASGTEDPYPY